MSVFRIEYVTPRGPDETEWVCPAGYTTQQAYVAFQSQNPSASVAVITRVWEYEDA
jgi:hypothetical protein